MWFIIFCCKSHTFRFLSMGWNFINEILLRQTFSRAKRKLAYVWKHFGSILSNDFSYKMSLEHEQNDSNFATYLKNYIETQRQLIRVRAWQRLF